MAGKGLVVTGLALLACMGESFMLAAPSQARGALINSGWLSSGKVVRATSSRSESTRCSMEATQLEDLNEYVKAKRLGEVDEATGVGRYEFNLEAPGSMTNRLNHRITRVIKDKADFPGHMKGQIPLQLMGEVNKFVVEEIMNDSILIALETYGLMGAEGEGSEAEMNTDMNELITNFKPGKSLFFTCTMAAKPKPAASENEDGDEAAEDATLSDSA
eukprot:jgi/Undpi1/4776/HiC_scaffold_18.g08129.m1